MRRPRWHQASLRTKALLILSVLLLPLLLAMFMLAFQTQMDREVDLRITETRQVRESASELMGIAVDAETGVRGFVASGNRDFLEPYSAAVGDLDRIEALVARAEVPPTVLQLLEDQYAGLRTLVSQVNLGPQKRESLLLEGKNNMDRLRFLIGTHVQQRTDQLQSELQQREELHRRTGFVLWLGGIGGVLGGSLGITLLTRDIIGRVKILQENSQLIDSAEPHRAIRGSDEIGELGRVLECSRRALIRKDELRHEAEVEMIRSRDEADRANRAKSEFLSRMSHELRTPLNAILGFAQLMEMGELRDDQHEAVHHIVRGGRHLLDLINEVLDISRIESGNLSLSLEPVALKELIEESIALMEPLAVEKGVHLSATFDPAFSERYVSADAQRLKQIVLNLLSNGVKYNRPGGSVRIAGRDAGGGVEMEITDTGLGLSPKDLESIFTPFDRLGADRLNIEGTGLGLALSKSLAEAMGGEIVVESEVDKGSSFFVRLKRAEEPVPDRVVPAFVKGDASVDTEHVVVLYIEDNPSDLKLVQSIFGHRPGVELLSAMQGGLGLQLARDHAPDIILLDVNLPDIDGGEVLRSLKSDPRTASIPVVMLSADATPGQIERLRSAGAVDYLTKPIDVARFLEVVDRFSQGVAA